MEPLTDLSTILYRLIYHRSFRNAFIAHDFATLNISSAVVSDIGRIDIVNLEKTSQLIIRQFLGDEDFLGFQAKFKETLTIWRELFPADSECFELVILFLESPDFEKVENIASHKDSTHIFAAFRDFLLNKLPENEKFKPLRNSLIRI